jgi:hypothetical protein
MSFADCRKEMQRRQDPPPVLRHCSLGTRFYRCLEHLPNELVTTRALEINRCSFRAEHQALDARESGGYERSDHGRQNSDHRRRLCRLLGCGCGSASRRPAGGSDPGCAEASARIRPRLYEAKPETLGVALLPLLRKIDVSFLGGEAVGLDAAAKVVTLATGDRLTYDRLVVATGSRMRRPPVPGSEAACSVDTQAEAIAFLITPISPPN